MRSGTLLTSKAADLSVSQIGCGCAKVESEVLTAKRLASFLPVRCIRFAVNRIVSSGSATASANARMIAYTRDVPLLAEQCTVLLRPAHAT